jgi:hypothetical protein
VLTRFEDLGAPPADPLRANEWAHGVVTVALHQTIHDPNISEKDRRAEIATLAGRMSALTPLSRISKAEATVLGRHEGSAEGPQTELTDATPIPAIDPAGSGPPARRGRPRKRSIL